MTSTEVHETLRFDNTMANAPPMPATHTARDLADQVRALGINTGDVVLVRAALKPVGKTAEPAGTVLIRALLDVVGEGGGILGLAFTRNYLLPRARESQAFTRETKATTGGFVNCMLSWPGAVRSRHPTNSWVAIGRAAADMLETHDARASCFEPIKYLVDRRGKMLLVGCVHDSPGFSTVHWAQHQLGLSKRNVVRGLFGAAYTDEGALRTYRKQDTPGCSLGFWKVYGAYVDAGLLRTGNVGDAYSAALDADKALDVERALLQRDPRAVLCDRSDCFSCRGTLFYNVADWPRFYVRHFPLVVRKQWKKIVQPRESA